MPLIGSLRQRDNELQLFFNKITIAATWGLDLSIARVEMGTEKEIIVVVLVRG